MAQPPAPVNQSFSEPPPPYSAVAPPVDGTKAAYATAVPYPGTAYPQQALGYNTNAPVVYPAGSTSTTIVTSQPASTVTVVRVGNCPRCQVRCLSQMEFGNH